MLEMRLSSCHEVSWDDVRLEIARLAPNMFAAIEELSPDRTYKLYETRYPYGEAILDANGCFRLPNTSGAISYITAADFDQTIRNEFHYSFPSIPMGIVMEGETQLFVEGENQHTFSPVLFRPGDIYALNRVLDLPKEFQASGYWRNTAGSRMPYMLPSISDQIKFNRLANAFNLPIHPPHDQRKHWQLFKSLANHADFAKPWYAKILFFGKKWIIKNTSKAGKLFRLALLEHAWEKTELKRNSHIFDKYWETSISKIRNKKVDRYILNMARHIIECGYGKVPSYQVADGNNSGPFEEIARLICEVYGLKEYAPLIMTPKVFNPAQDKDTYVSIQLPTIDLLRQRTSRSHLLSADFREIMFVINKFMDENRKTILARIPIYNIENFLYRFYATDKSKNNEFLFSEDAFIDNVKAEIWKKPGNDKISPYNTFMRACIRITYKA